jgi:MarR family transcriptional regulator for hemolysin
MTDWNVFESPAPLINMAARSFARLGERRVKAHGFSVGQLPVLYLLKDGVALSQKQLAQMVKIEQPSMAQMLARMERDGLIRRTPDPNDGRSSLVSLTETALSRLPAARESLSEGSGRALAGFSDEEVGTLIGLLQRLNANLDQLVADEAD